MQLCQLLNQDRIVVEQHRVGSVTNKGEALSSLAVLLANGVECGAPTIGAADIEAALLAREALQSTGIGEGVAIPHGALSALDVQRAALLIVPDGVEFEAIDGGKVHILFAIVGPRKESGEHLKALARISRLLRDPKFRARLVGTKDAADALALIRAEEAHDFPSVL